MMSFATVRRALFFLVLVVPVGLIAYQKYHIKSPQVAGENTASPLGIDRFGALAIESMRKRAYPGSDITVLENLENGSDYKRQIVSYTSDGFAIHALLTVPTTPMPEGGYPVIIFNHGYIPPEQYKTTENYVAYVDGFAKSGYVVIKPDYRGNGESEGTPEGAYYSPAYTVDVLNALASVKKLSYVNPDKIGMWGHSMGGHITLAAMVVSKDIKAGVIWGGVVASAADLIRNWHRRTPFHSSPRELESGRMGRQMLVHIYGEPEMNPDFWNAISPIHFVADISGPVQLHHGLADTEVPASFSASLRDALVEAGKPVQMYEYPGADHNLSQAFTSAMQRSVTFFDSNLKDNQN